MSSMKSFVVLVLSDYAIIRFNNCHKDTAENYLTYINNVNILLEEYKQTDNYIGIPEKIEKLVFPDKEPDHKSIKHIFKMFGGFVFESVWAEMPGNSTKLMEEYYIWLDNKIKSYSDNYAFLFEDIYEHTISLKMSEEDIQFLNNKINSYIDELLNIKNKDRPLWVFFNRTVDSVDLDFMYLGLIKARLIHIARVDNKEALILMYNKMLDYALFFLKDAVRDYINDVIRDNRVTDEDVIKDSRVTDEDIKNHFPSYLDNFLNGEDYDAYGSNDAYNTYLLSQNYLKYILNMLKEYSDM